jgi:hypothetical protein
MNVLCIVADGETEVMEGNFQPGPTRDGLQPNASRDRASTLTEEASSDPGPSETPDVPLDRPDPLPPIPGSRGDLLSQESGNHTMTCPDQPTEPAGNTGPGGGLPITGSQEAGQTQPTEGRRSVDGDNDASMDLTELKQVSGGIGKFLYIKNFSFIVNQTMCN